MMMSPIRNDYPCWASQQSALMCRGSPVRRSDAAPQRPVAGFELGDRHTQNSVGYCQWVSPKLHPCHVMTEDTAQQAGTTGRIGRTQAPRASNAPLGATPVLLVASRPSTVMEEKESDVHDTATCTLA